MTSSSSRLAVAAVTSSSLSASNDVADHSGKRQRGAAAAAAAVPRRTSKGRTSKSGGATERDGAENGGARGTKKGARKDAPMKKRGGRPGKEKKSSSAAELLEAKSYSSEEKGKAGPMVIAPDDDGGGSGGVYIQFSRAFQRHVVYRRNSDGNTNTNTNSCGANAGANGDEVVRSFEFLDEALVAFPDARVMAPRDLPLPPPSCSLVYADEGDDGGGGDRRVGPRPAGGGGSRGRPIDADAEEGECESTIAGMGLWTVCELDHHHHHRPESDEGEDEGVVVPWDTASANDALRTLLRIVSSSADFTVPRHFFRLDPRRFATRGHTSESIKRGHSRVVDLLSRGVAGNSHHRDGGDDDGVVGLAMGPADVAFVMQNFPQLCLYDTEELEGLVGFLLNPLPPGGSFPSVKMVADGRATAAARVGGGAAPGLAMDWPSLWGRGYGAGLTVDQATKAIRMMPELLALYHEDSRKPSMMYMYSQLEMAVGAVSPKLMDEANAQLDLEGTDPADAYTFAYLRSLGISWGQLRMLVDALPLWTTCGLDPGWELLSSPGPVRSMLKRPSLDYLRQRLQIGPGDVYRLVKTHTRLSTYDACSKILPILDGLQGELGLSSAELRKLVLRMPSLMGMGMTALTDRLDFFEIEAGMSMEDLKVAVMRQPSLLQYGVSSTLRPKLAFFVNELGVPQPSVTRIVKLAPSAMGLSLTENLRPKAASIMRMCALVPRDVGHIASTSPQALLLSQKGKIEPTLRFLASALMLREPRELGEVILIAPRVLAHGVESSLARKMGLLAERAGEDSGAAAVAIIRNNPALLACSYAVLEDRCDRCPADTDIATWLLPSNKGRRKVIPRSEEEFERENPIFESLDEFPSFDSMTRIYPSTKAAAEELGVTELAIRDACGGGNPIAGSYLYSLADYRPRSQTGLSEVEESETDNQRKRVPISLFCSGASYPSDNDNLARGQSRTGGLSVQVFTNESSQDKSHFLRDFSNAAKSCFGIRVPIGDNHDGSKSIAVFPLVNPSRNRCELFSCSAALRILEVFMESRRDESETLYDIKVYTDSNYAWKLVRSDKLLKLGSHFTSQEMLLHVDMPGYSVNIDILNPLARSFSRLNGRPEPHASTHRPFDNAKVEFIHSMDGIGLINGGLVYVKRLRREARLAAMWQFNRERNLV